MTVLQQAWASGDEELIPADYVNLLLNGETPCASTATCAV